MLHTIEVSDERVYRVVISPDGTRFVTADRAGAKVWDAAPSNYSYNNSHLLQLGASATYDIAFSPDSMQVVTALEDRSIRVWNVGTAAADLSHRLESASHFLFPMGGRLLVQPHGRDAFVRELTNGETLYSLPGTDETDLTVEFSHDGALILTYTQDNGAQIWDSYHGRRLHAIDPFPGGIASAMFSPDGQKLAFKIGASSVYIIELMNELRALNFEAPGPILDIDWSSDGARVVAAIAGDQAEIWEFSATRGAQLLNRFSGRPEDLAVSPDGSHIATASLSEGYRILDGITGEILHNLEAEYANEDSVSLTFSSDGTRLMTWAKYVEASSYNTPRIWDVLTGENLVSLEDHNSALSLASFSPDGRMVVTAQGLGHNLRVWDVASGIELAILRGHGAPVIQAAFSSDGDKLVTTSEDKTARVWDLSDLTLSGDALISAACDRLPFGRRSLTHDEARRFLGNPNHPDAAPCERVGPLSPRYYTRALERLFGGGDADRGVRSAPDSATSGGRDRR